MDSSASNWEAAFGLSEASRARVVRSCRLRHCHSSTGRLNGPGLCENHNPLPQKDATPGSYHCESVRPVISSRISDEEKHAKGGHDATSVLVAEPSSRILKAKRTKSLKKNAASKSNSLDCDNEARPSIITRDLEERLHSMGSSPSNLRSDNMLDTDVGTSEKIAATQIHVSEWTCTSSKRAKNLIEIADSEVDYEKLPARLEQDFFRCDALELAPKLLGKLLRRDDVVLQITEAEAYRPNDSACHGRFGLTSRTAAMFGPAGHAYVYLCYGMHVMLNIVADNEGVGAAVLIRSCAPIAGLKTIQSRRGILSSKPILLTGPGKIGQALGITTEWSSHPLYLPGGLELLDGPLTKSILVGPRVGILYANPEDVAALWRFATADTPWISAPRNNLMRRDNFF